MTLRLRLTLALVALATIGLGLFGLVTYSLYARSQYERLDEQLRAAVLPINLQLNRAAGLDPGAPTGGGSATTIRPGATGPTTGPPPPNIAIPLEAYGLLLDGAGNVLAVQQPSSTTSPPSLPSPLPRNLPPTTVASVDGTGQWRVTVSPSDRVPGQSVVAAVPLTEVQAALDRLVVIEAVAAAVLLAVLAAGSWLILRRGLQPLEHMATSARAIAAGDLSERVSPADETTEVGQLGLALNTMLGEIEQAFLEREATEARLRQFLADASHELRTPLTSIQGFAELYRLGGESDVAELDHVNLEIILRRIEEESARMKVLVEDLLLLARLDQTRPVERVTVDLAVLAADACSDAVALDPTRPVTLDAPEPVVISGDLDHLRQAIANLVTNAVHHTPVGTPVEVGAHLVDGNAVVTVRDHGEGLDPEAMAHAFDRFWRADAARVGTGAGLGLAIVAAIAHEHGATVSAGNADGGGACFTMRFPLNAATPALLTS